MKDVMALHQLLSGKYYATQNLYGMYIDAYPSIAGYGDLMVEVYHSFEPSGLQGMLRRGFEYAIVHRKGKPLYGEVYAHVLCASPKSFVVITFGKNSVSVSEANLLTFSGLQLINAGDIEWFRTLCVDASKHSITGSHTLWDSLRELEGTWNIGMLELDMAENKKELTKCLKL